MAPLLLHSVSKGLWGSSFYLRQAPQQPPPSLTGCLAASHRKQLFVLCKWWLMSRLAQRAVSDKLLMASLSEVLVQVTESSILRWITAQSCRCTVPRQESNLAWLSSAEPTVWRTTQLWRRQCPFLMCWLCFAYLPYKLWGYFKRSRLLCCVIIHAAYQQFWQQYCLGIGWELSYATAISQWRTSSELSSTPVQ